MFLSTQVFCGKQRKFITAKIFPSFTSSTSLMNVAQGLIFSLKLRPLEETVRLMLYGSMIFSVSHLVRASLLLIINCVVQCLARQQLNSANLMTGRISYSPERHLRRGSTVEFIGCRQKSTLISDPRAIQCGNLRGDITKKKFCYIAP